MFLSYGTRAVYLPVLYGFWDLVASPSSGCWGATSSSAARVVSSASGLGVTVAPVGAGSVEQAFQRGGGGGGFGEPPWLGRVWAHTTGVVARAAD